MTDPERLLDGGGSELERELLGALASERPSPLLSRRIRQGLVALGVLTSAKTSVAAIMTLVGLVSVGAGAAWVAGHERSEPQRLALPRAAEKVSRVATSAVRATPPVTSEAPPPNVESPAPARSAVAAPSSPGGDLRDQIALLDRARAAVRARESRTALAELAAYSKRFPRGEFSQEVTVLKIEALVQNGQMDAARALGNRFLKAHPESPHVERIERLIGARR